MPPKKVQLVQLCCLVHGDPEISVFSVKISKSENSVNVDLTTENPQRAALGDLNADITSVLGGQLLNPLESIEKKFPTLPSMHVHVIVELPASSNVAEFQSESSMKRTIDLFTDTTQQFHQYIANMNDVLEVTTEEEMLRWKVRQILRRLEETPGFLPNNDVVNMNDVANMNGVLDVTTEKEIFNWKIRRMQMHSEAGLPNK
ncbi:hypothetical protein C2G38_2183725 [Gigaspora rosea]|uniref:Uncharacterized protein n=1 Tax=Gigaspora rosea TaxID=44941 RepID=A0A397V878_9GLOM|nr:hypothetical protein C2G38_2183725 [Gigaspora rosea]